MKISPLNIKRQTFKKSLKGFDTAEVTGFLDLLAGQVEELEKEKNAALDDARQLRTEIEKYLKMEKMLQDSLVQSQKSLEDAKKNAEKEVHLAIKEAEIKAHCIEEEAFKKVEKMKREMLILKEQKDTYIIKFRALIKSQLEMIDVIEFEPDLMGKKLTDTGDIKNVVESSGSQGDTGQVKTEMLDQNQNFSAKIP
jgi:cell division initiation protein